MTEHANRIVRFIQMKDGTREDYELLELHERDYLRVLPDRILAALACARDRPRRIPRDAPRAFAADRDPRAQGRGR